MTIGNESTTRFHIDADGAFNGTFNQAIHRDPDIIIESNADLDIVLEGTPQVGDSWTLISGYQTSDGQFAQGENFTNADGKEFDIAYDTGANNNDIVATYIPEPAVLGLMGLFGMLALLRRKLRSKS